MEIELLGPYKIVGKLGRGGMGVVYEAVHRETGEPAAVKLLSAALAQEEGFRVRFEAEIETLKKLNHPNIVRLFGFGEQDGHLFYAMELVDGDSIEEELRRGRCFDWRETVSISIEICRALRHAHDRGIIHRDIKPGNLLLTTDNHVKLSDFGIAKLFGNTRLTSVGSVVGTAEYMAPEQAEGRAVDARSDLYSLGALMYVLLARRPVFRGKSLLEVLQKQRFEQPEPLSRYAPDVPDELQRIVAQLLEKNPERRIPTATVLCRRLEELLQKYTPTSETIEADSDWFKVAEGALPAIPPDLQPPDLRGQDEVAGGSNDPGTPTIDLPSTVVQTELPHVSSSSEDSFELATEVKPVQASKEPTAANAEPTKALFIPVSEEELDPAAKDEQPPLISWQTIALALALLAMGLSIRWFLQPPSAESLFNKIASRMENDADKPLSLRRSDVKEIEAIINEFLSRYPHDPNARRVRQYEKDLELRNLELEFEWRIRDEKRIEGLLPIERMYLEAMSYARSNPTRAAMELQALIDLYNQPEDKKDATGVCLSLARHQLAILRQEVEKLATDQQEMLKKRLDAADAIRNTDPERAEKLYRAVIQLYSDKPWAETAVQRARQSLENKPANSH